MREVIFLSWTSPKEKLSLNRAVVLSAVWGCSFGLCGRFDQQLPGPVRDPEHGGPDSGRCTGGHGSLQDLPVRHLGGGECPLGVRHTAAHPRHLQVGGGTPALHPSLTLGVLGVASPARSSVQPPRPARDGSQEARSVGPGAPSCNQKTESADVRPLSGMASRGVLHSALGHEASPMRSPARQGAHGRSRGEGPGNGLGSHSLEHRPQLTRGPVRVPSAGVEHRQEACSLSHPVPRPLTQQRSLSCPLCARHVPGTSTGELCVQRRRMELDGTEGRRQSAEDQWGEHRGAASPLLPTPAPGPSILPYIPHLCSRPLPRGPLTPHPCSRPLPPGWAQWGGAQWAVSASSRCPGQEEI